MNASVQISTVATSLSSSGIAEESSSQHSSGGGRRVNRSFFRQRISLLNDGIHALDGGRHEFRFIFVLPRNLPPTLLLANGTYVY